MYVHGLIIDEATETLFKPIVYLKHINYFYDENQIIQFCIVHCMDDQVPITSNTYYNNYFGKRQISYMPVCQWREALLNQPPIHNMQMHLCWVVEPRGRGGCQVALAVHVHYTVHVTKLQYLSAGNMPGTIPTPRFALWQIMPVPSFDKGGGQH